jgi:hypothetical protein
MPPPSRALPYSPDVKKDGTPTPTPRFLKDAPATPTNINNRNDNMDVNDDDDDDDDGPEPPRPVSRLLEEHGDEESDSSDMLLLLPQLPRPEDVDMHLEEENQTQISVELARRALKEPSSLRTARMDRLSFGSIPFSDRFADVDGDDEMQQSTRLLDDDDDDDDDDGGGAAGEVMVEGSRRFMG